MVQRLDQTVQHPADLCRRFQQQTDSRLAQVVETECDLDVCFQLHQRAACETEVVEKLLSARAAVPFGDICRNGDCGALELAREAIHLALRKPGSSSIAHYNEIHRFLPNFQV